MIGAADRAHEERRNDIAHEDIEAEKAPVDVRAHSDSRLLFDVLTSASLASALALRPLVGEDRFAHLDPFVGERKRHGVGRSP